MEAGAITKASQPMSVIVNPPSKKPDEKVNVYKIMRAALAAYKEQYNG
jgi:hypothetical protein